MTTVHMADMAGTNVAMQPDRRLTRLEQLVAVPEQLRAEGERLRSDNRQLRAENVELRRRAGGYRHQCDMRKFTYAPCRPNQLRCPAVTEGTRRVPRGRRHPGPLLDAVSGPAGGASFERV